MIRPRQFKYAEVTALTQGNHGFGVRVTAQLMHHHGEGDKIITFDASKEDQVVIGERLTVTIGPCVDEGEKATMQRKRIQAIEDEAGKRPKKKRERRELTGARK